MTVDDETGHINKNDLVLARKGQKVFIENDSDDDLEYLEITCKAGRNILSDGLEYIMRLFCSIIMLAGGWIVYYQRKILQYMN